jgi:hypothetical protein
MGAQTGDGCCTMCGKPYHDVLKANPNVSPEVIREKFKQFREYLQESELSPIYKGGEYLEQIISLVLKDSKSTMRARIKSSEITVAETYEYIHGLDKIISLAIENINMLIVGTESPDDLRGRAVKMNGDTFNLAVKLGIIDATFKTVHAPFREILTFRDILTDLRRNDLSPIWIQLTRLLEFRKPIEEIIWLFYGTTIDPSTEQPDIAYTIKFMETVEQDIIDLLNEKDDTETYSRIVDLVVKLGKIHGAFPTSKEIRKNFEGQRYTKKLRKLKAGT